MSIEKLNHKSILKAMFKDRMISVDEAKRVDVNLNNANPTPSHPLVGIARSLPSHKETGQSITLEPLCEWFAKTIDVEYFYIDPLKIDIASVTKVIASDYAKRHGFLAVKATHERVTLAVKNPLDLSWKDNLENLLRKEIEIVFANPLEVDRYVSEFYRLANRSANRILTMNEPVQAFSKTSNSWLT